LAAAVVLYPACRDFLRRTFAIGEPLLMLLGAKDDWTPPGPCLELAEATRAKQPGTEFEMRVYEDSAHGFDSARPVRFWKGIPNGTDPVGVHVGGNPAARAAAFTEIDTFLRRHLEK
jgi:dienelactone hydrolase